MRNTRCVIYARMTNKIISVHRSDVWAWKPNVRNNQRMSHLFLHNIKFYKIYSKSILFNWAKVTNSKLMADSCIGHIWSGSGGPTADGGELHTKPATTGLCMTSTNDLRPFSIYFWSSSGYKSTITIYSTHLLLAVSLSPVVLKLSF